MQKLLNKSIRAYPIMNGQQKTNDFNTIGYKIIVPRFLMTHGLEKKEMANLLTLLRIYFE